MGMQVMWQCWLGGSLPKYSQPWVVYGIMRTKDGLSHTVSADQVGLSLFIFVVVYTIVFGSGIYYTLKLINKTCIYRHAKYGSRRRRTL